ncbi:uncharacterized protein PgNI_09445 [Pyricularia grisea]|uniref:Uncharacterized protein n=1 Tax=Pyricularia grisea TaxID=148305 RepID=A0A6P8ATH3_PYRGI|nr:uncharacterized protein PgNI_09445 [Pyricularia grisea]TLD05431.1 hypothetical protein PgNI_09445 [Pyricularia grisea]
MSGAVKCSLYLPHSINQVASLLCLECKLQVSLPCRTVLLSPWHHVSQF